MKKTDFTVCLKFIVSLKVQQFKRSSEQVLISKGHNESVTYTSYVLKLISSSLHTALAKLMSHSKEKSGLNIHQKEKYLMRCHLIKSEFLAEHANHQFSIMGSK